MNFWKFTEGQHYFKLLIAKPCSLPHKMEVKKSKEKKTKSKNQNLVSLSDISDSWWDKTGSASLLPVILLLKPPIFYSAKYKSTSKLYLFYLICSARE